VPYQNNVNRGKRTRNTPPIIQNISLYQLARSKFATARNNVIGITDQRIPQPRAAVKIEAGRRSHVPPASAPKKLAELFDEERNSQTRVKSRRAA
jgi:hypothetical protein